MKSLRRAEEVQDLTVTLADEGIGTPLARRVAELIVDEILPYARDEERVKESLIAVVKAVHSWEC